MLAQIAAAGAGGSLADWQDLLAEEPLLAELLHEDSAAQHRANEWCQEAWDSNHFYSFCTMNRSTADHSHCAANKSGLGALYQRTD